MASFSAVSGGQSETLQLLEQYCCRRSRQRSMCQAAVFQGPASSRPKEHLAPAPTFRKIKCPMVRIRDDAEVQSDGSSSRRSSAVAERLMETNDSAPIPEVEVEDQDEIVRKLVELMITSGDDMDMKIHRDPVLQEQLSNLSYDTFQRVTSSMQSLVQTGGAESEEQIQQRKISWAFEVTSRLSTVGVVQRRRVLSYGDQYVEQHHSAWIQERGGWDKVFDVD